MVRYNGLVWSNIAVPVLLPSYIDDPWADPRRARMIANIDPLVIL